MGTVGSHKSPFKNYPFGLCHTCGKRGRYQGRTANTVKPMYYQRCRLCGTETFTEAPARELVTIGGAA